MHHFAFIKQLHAQIQTKINKAIVATIIGFNTSGKFGGEYGG
jgi:hypothetical protein